MIIPILVLLLVLSGPSYAAAPILDQEIEVLPLTSRGRGKYPWGPITIPAGVKDVDVIVAVVKWISPTDQLIFSMEQTLDGITWKGCGSGSQGGKRAATSVGCPIRDAASASRQVKGYVTVLGTSKMDFNARVRTYK